MSKRTSRANAKKSAVRAKIEPVVAEQQARMELLVQTIGLARAELKIELANLLYTIKRAGWLNQRPAPA